MSSLIQGLGFATPLALWGLLALPVIWWLLRFVPPRPKPVSFPPIRILLGLDPKLETPDKTPWWLLLLRLVLAGLLIIGVSHPTLTSGHVGDGMGGHSLVIIDNGWAAASDWGKRQDYLSGLLEEARSSDGRITLVTTTHSVGQPTTIAAGVALDKAKALHPLALSPDRAATLKSLKAARLDVPDRIIWLSDGLSAGTFPADVMSLFAKANLSVVAPKTADLPVALVKPVLDGSSIKATVLKSSGLATELQVQARAANGRVLAEQSVKLAANDASANVAIELPTELRNEVQSLTIAKAEHAGARQLLDDRWRRKTVALQSGSSFETTQPLLSPLHYISRALEPSAELFEPKSPEELTALLDGGVSMLVLADIGVMANTMAEDVAKWVDKGGLLVRFAGPRMAAAVDELVPVRLREGGRELGSALSWEAPQPLQAFGTSSPFAGLAPDARAMVSQQVLAEPDTDLADHTWASLADGTPLVTAAKRGKGLIVLFHVTANPEWSTLPVTGLFVDMLKRIADLAPPAGSTQATDTALLSDSDAYTPRLILSGKGDLVSPDGDASPIAVADFDKATASPQTPAGLYARGGSERAINLSITPADMAALGTLPVSATRVDFTPPKRESWTPYFFLAALGLFFADVLAALMLGGGMSRLRPVAAAAALIVALGIGGQVQDARAGDTDTTAMQAALQTHLAYVRTGNGDIDDVSDKGLKGLGLVINDRTSITLADPMGIDIEHDDIVFYPLLYWPIDANAVAPSPAAVAKIDTYMKKGGTIFFDLRDDGLGAGSLSSGTSATAEALQRILGTLDIPPLEPVAERHVLTRSFYLLDTFPGRYADGPLWVEAGNSGGATDPGTTDGVSAIIIGSNDYAAAWALDDTGNPLFAVIPGNDRQREFAFRTGINVVMYALTGNYKADQVHVPALLERLGQ
jgi:Domain of unknown function (DUF4159)/Aerotolerance regulator N-terminal